MMIGPKPDRGSADEAALLQAFVHSLSKINWHKALLALGEETLLVVDPEVREAIEACYGALQCQLAAPTESEAACEGAKRVLFLCRRSEWQLVKQARKQFPDKTVLSLTYDVMPLGQLESRRFPETMPGTVQGELIPPEKILMSTAGSDAEYLALGLTNNSSLKTIKAVGSATAYWVLLVERLQLLRFARRLLAASAEKGSVVSFDLHVYYVLLSNSWLTSDVFVDWLNGNGTSVLYLLTRDRIRQAAILQLLEREEYASLWDRSEATVARLDPTVLNDDLVVNHLMQLLELEARVESPLQALASFKVISLEDLVQSPSEVMAAIGIFWGFHVPSDISLPDWLARYQAISGLGARLSDLRNAVTAKLGLT